MVYVIVLSYHAPDDLRRCIASVLRTEYPPGRFRLVVVDNDATPDTAAVCAAFAGAIDVLPQRANTGYAEGMNIGIRHALHAGAEYIVCLNQDIEVDSAWLAQLVMAMEADAKVGAVQPRIMLGQTNGGGEDNSTKNQREGFVNSIGNEIHPLGFAYAGGHRERWEDVRMRLRGFPYPEVTYCSGAAVMYRAAALREVALPHFSSSRASPRVERSRMADEISPLRARTHSGRNDEGGEEQYFDSSYFMYHEDVDLGVRLRMCGWTCALAPQAVVTHYYEFSRSVRKLEWMERNRLLFLFENFRWPTLLLLAPALLTSECALALFAVRNGWWPAKRNAWAALVRPAHWRMFWRARAARQEHRRMPDRAIVRRFTPRFANQEMPNALVERVINPLVVLWWLVLRRIIVW